MKIVLIGGHFTTALAVLEALPQDSEIVFLGRKHALEGDKAESLEYRTITEKGIRFVPLTTGRFTRALTTRSLLSFSKLPKGFWQAHRVLRREKPDVVVGFGGYLSVPVGIAAYLLRIPLVIHEQTLEAGLANKILARFATKICVSWDESKKFFPKNKTIVTGNPVRKSIFTVHNQNKSSTPTIFITGGSAGSHAINLVIEKTLPKLVQLAKIIHQTGDAKAFTDFDRLTTLKDSLPDKNTYEVTKFVSPDKISEYISCSTIVVGRAGINTVSELLYFGKPAIFIPLPFAQKNEQYKNAMLLKKLGMAEIIEQKNLTPETFLKTVQSMLENITEYEKNKEDARKMIHTNATQEIVEVITSVVRS